MNRTEADEFRMNNIAELQVRETYSLKCHFCVATRSSGFNDLSETAYDLGWRCIDGFTTCPKCVSAEAIQ